MNLGEQVVVPALQILCQKLIKQNVDEFLRHADGENRKCFDAEPNYIVLRGLANLISYISEQQHVIYTKFDKINIANSAIVMLEDYAKQEYIRNMIHNFFDLLLKWPKSRSNFVELKQLMDNTSMDVVYEIIVSLQRQFHSKLLRPGLNTLDILAVYTAAIRALRIIDPSRVVQDLVCEPVRMYLRSRPDTVRCIMSHITHISSSRFVKQKAKKTTVFFFVK